MKKLYGVLLGFLCLCFSAHAQSVQINYSNEVCVGSLHQISVNVNGEFKADNQFTVQVRQADNSKIFAAVPAVYKNGYIQVTHTDTLLWQYNNLQLRILTSSPKSESNWSSLRIYRKGSVSLLIAESDTINAGDDLKIQFTTISNSSAYITLSDSTKHSVYNYGNNISYFSLPVFNSTPLFIAHAENSCGAMSVSGQIRPVINPVSLRIVSTASAGACEDGEIKIGFSVLGSPFPSQTKYRLRFTEANSYSERGPRQAEVVATLKDKFLTAKVPKSLNIKSATAFKIQVITENPAVLSTYSDFSINIYPKANAEFSSSSRTINIGENFQANVTFTGMPPFTAELQDGSVFTSTSEGTAYLNLNPEQTSSYTIKSFTSGCGQVTEPGKQALVVTVNPGIYLESNGERQILCIGAPSRIPILTNMAHTADTKYYVTVYFNDSQSTTQKIPATRAGNFLEFTPPPLTASQAHLSYDNVYTVSVITDFPRFQSNTVNYKYVFQGMPDLLSSGSTLNYTSPGKISLNFNLKGRGPMTIEDPNGRKYQINDSYWYTEIFLKETMDFKIKSISNACFKNENVQPVRITLNTANTAAGLYIEPLKNYVCYQDSIEISFLTTGNFNEGNVFNIQGYADCCTFQTLATVKSNGKYKIKIPVTQNSYASFRVASTNPVLFSDQFSTELQRPPSNFYINPQGTASSPVIFYQNYLPYLSLSNNGGSATSFVYSDGAGDYTAQLELNNARVNISPPMGVTTAYTIKSATNQCGSSPVNLTTYIKRVPYRISVGYIDYNNVNFCQGSPMNVSFTTSEGNAANATFSLQIFKDGSTDFITLAKDQTSRQFSSIVPSDLAAGTYSLRIISSDGAVSEPTSVRIGSLPTATLSSALPQPVEIERGQSLELKLSFTGSGPWTVVYENNTRQIVFNNPTSFYYTPLNAQDYTLKTVYNSCGYGTASGKVSVKVKPRLATSTDSYNVCQGGTFNVTYALEGDADLTSDYIRFELIDNVSQKVFVLDSTKALSGKRLLNIPAILSGSSYQIRCTVKSYNIINALYVTVTTKADLTLTGNTTINAGQSAQLVIINNKISGSFDQIKYKLSDGTDGFLSNYSGTGNYYIAVTPSKTTTYTLTSATNSCGEGIAKGSATVEVNPLSERSINVTNFASINGRSSCIGDTIFVYYDTKGSFSAQNLMTVQISDSTGKNFRPITTIGNTSPLKAVIASDLFSGKNYRVRVTATDPNTGSGAYQYPVVFSQKAKARFASESVLYDGIKNPKIVVLLEGGGPWYYYYGTDLQSIGRGPVRNASDTITLLQASPNQYYKLFRVENSCGIGTIGTPATVRVEVITAEPAAFSSRITVAPNPTQDFLRLKFETALPRSFTLFNIQGIPVQKGKTQSNEEEVDIRMITSGIYILQIESQGRKDSFKVIKQ